MFKDPGTKIKKLINTFFWIEVAAVVLAVLGLMADELFESGEGILIGVDVIVVGVGVAYISALFLAAFGELVETNSALLEETHKSNGE